MSALVPAQPMSLVSFDNVSVAFGRTRVLSELNWNWRWGESVLVVGPSGAGKSTLAALATGLIPASIEAEVSGELDRDPRLSRPGAVGYVFQDPDSQFCQLRVGEEVAFGLENSSSDPAAMDAVVVDALSQSGIVVPADQEHMTLSGGNKQKVALASALSLTPEVMVLDEPTANLDPASTYQVFREIERLVESGTTVMVIEHKFQDLVERIPLMLLLDARGRLYRVGPSRVIMEQERDWMEKNGLLPRSEGRVRHLPMVSPEPILSLSGVSARYHRHGPLSLTDISLDIHGGELVALVGANGAGKSTLLKVAAGLMKNSGGRIVRPAGGVGLGFQNPEHQFVFERVVDELANRYVGDAPPKGVRQLLDLYRLGDQSAKSPYSLSQGQKRRLSVAIMLEHDRSLYCLDEPTFGQDAATRHIIMEQLQERQTRGAAVVVSTHDMDLVRHWATRVIALESGKVVFNGPWEELRTQSDLLRRCRLIDDGLGQEPLRSSEPYFSHTASALRKSLMGRLNPAWKLVSIFFAVGMTAFAHHLDQALPLAAIPIALLLGFSGLPVKRVLKRLGPFIIFFGLYVWMMTAYAQVGPRTPVFHFLWYRLSYPGFIDGLVLGFRMLSAVGFGLLFVSTVDLVDLVKSLSREFRIPPKFSYGTLAGLRFFPQFEQEWQKLRMARRVRGRDVRWSVNRVATYALPLLSDAVRLSERVAIAMEARGFRGAAAQLSRGRTYYHPSTAGWRDVWFGTILLGAAILSLWH